MDDRVDILNEKHLSAGIAPMTYGKVFAFRILFGQAIPL